MERSKFLENLSPIASQESFSGFYRDFKMSYECMTEVRKLELELASTKKMLNEALRFLGKVSGLMDCDAKYFSDCSACDLEDFVRIASEMLAKHEKKEGV